jgi:hypothetical protein
MLHACIILSILINKQINNKKKKKHPKDDKFSQVKL